MYNFLIDNIIITLVYVIVPKIVNTIFDTFIRFKKYNPEQKLLKVQIYFYGKSEK